MTCGVRDAVMDTLKKITPSSLFHSGHIVLDRVRNSNVTSHHITAFRASQYNPTIPPPHRPLNVQLTGSSVEQRCLLHPQNGLCTVGGHFFQTQREKSLDSNVCVLPCVMPVAHLALYCCWLNRWGGVVISVTVLQPDSQGSILSDSQSPPR